MLVGGKRRTSSSLLLKSQVLAGHWYFLPKGIGRPETCSAATEFGNHYGTMKIFCTYGSFTLLPGV
jgi:hypothetical protein